MLEFSRQKLGEIHESNSAEANSQVETMFYNQFDKYNAGLCNKEQGMVEEGELPISAQIYLQPVLKNYYWLNYTYL
uniref:Uncharacterized protein n=1 Tax=Ditylenchus dipsaci TaxID=166011 RepID=A0A915DJ49_9BILA